MRTEEKSREWDQALFNKCLIPLFLSPFNYFLSLCLSISVSSLSLSESPFIYHFPEGLPHNPPFSHCIYDILDFLLPLIFIYVLPYRVKLY